MAVLLAAFALAGCGGADASKEIETLQSWRATTDLAANAQLHGWVTPRYAHQLHDEGGKAASQGDQLAGSDKVTPVQRDSLRATNAELRAALDRLARIGP